MKIQSFINNLYQENSYIVSFADGSCLFIDCGASSEAEWQPMQHYVESEGLRPMAHLFTHSHPDHICGAEYVQLAYGLSPVQQLAPHAPISCETIATPGHKEDAVCFWLKEGDEEVLFSGDTLFMGSVGRTDLPGGDYATLMTSLRRLITLPDTLRVFPGHGPATTIAHEKHYNPFLTTSC